MIENIKNIIKDKYNLSESKWIFFSWFDQNWKLIFSNWLLETDKPLSTLIEDLYLWFIEKSKKKIKILICDVVTIITEITSYENIYSLSPKEYWFAMISIDSNSSWVILPDTFWVADAKNAFSLIKTKYWLKWKVRVYSFQTNRITIQL